MKFPIPTTLLACVLISQATASETTSPPILEFTSGPAGQQVRLTWPSQAGLSYRIEKSTTLDNESPGRWIEMALVEADGENTLWVDPQPTTTRAFYRVSLPEVEVTQISPPVLSTTGGILQIHGQCIPAGSLLILEIDGEAPVSIPLSFLGDGVWEADVSGTFVSGARVIAARIEDGSSLVLLDLELPIAVTETGRAEDSPPSLPPAAPMASPGDPVPGIGITHDFSLPTSADDLIDCTANDTCRTQRSGTNPLHSGSETTGDNPLFGSTARLGKKGYDYYKAQSDHDAASLASTGSFSKKGYDAYQAKGSMGAAALPSGSTTKKGYDHYVASSRSHAAGAQTNPYFVSNEMAGEMVSPAAAPSGLPGEVSFRITSLSIPCPAGPPLAWTCTYRSLKPVSSGLGDGWDFSYNISIEPLPASDGAGASRLVIRDGGGRADVFHRQSDGSYRCDGMFREGHFNGEVFTLTFADQGTWTFNALDGSPEAGKISSITDRNGVALACSYDGLGQLARVSDGFGRSLQVGWDTLSPPRITSVSSTGDRGAVFATATFSYSANARQLTACSAPFVEGTPPVAGNTTFTYSSGSPDPRLNDNLLSITDGAGRLLEAFTYSTSTDSGSITYDTSTSHDRNRIQGTGHVVRTSFATFPGGYTMTGNDELGRVCETDFDLQHRVISRREYTGFATPGEIVTASSNRPAGKLRTSDPDFFETTFRYNADSRCTSITHPDGSRERVTYERDLKPDCPVRERGNARVVTIETPAGEARTVTCQYLPGFGAPESARPGNPIGGLNVKGGRNPGGSHATRGGGLSSGVIAGIAIGAYSMALDDDGDGIPTGSSRRGWDGTYKGNPRLSSATDGIDDDCDGFVTSMTSSLGQTFTQTYDARGNCTGSFSPLPDKGALYQYDGLGRCTSVTTLNGPASSFRDEFVYDGDTGFLRSLTCDSTGLQLTTTCVRDAQGRITRIVDPRGNDWLYGYDPLHRCIVQRTPATPTRVTTLHTYDAGNRLVRCDTDHLAPDGSPVAANPVYTTFLVYDSRARLIRVAEEERPVDSTGLLTPDPATISDYAVTDITYDDAGQGVTLSTPAACRAQTTDLACDFLYDERGLLLRVVEGGLSSPSPVTTEYDYDSFGSLVRCATVGNGVTSAETHYAYDGFHRLLAVTDPMGNETSFDYSVPGEVTCSVFGEPNDVPGATGNILLWRSSVRRNGYEIGVDGGGPMARAGHTTRRRVEVLKSNKQGDPNANRYDFGAAPTGSTTARRRVEVLKSNKQGDPDANRYDFGSPAFFDLDVEDDTIVSERFTPGAPGPHATETTIVDRSPAGLVEGVTRNGDLLLACTYDSAGRLASTSNGACTVTLVRDANGNVLVCGKTDHFLAGGGGPPDKTFSVTRAYDPLNRCLQSTDGSGNVTQYAHDSLGRCVSITEPGGLVITTDFDGSGPGGLFSSRVSADVNGDGSPEVLASSFARCGELVSTTDSYGHTTSYTRDSLGRVVRCDHPDTTFETWSYSYLDENNEWVCQDACVRTIVHDLNGRPLSISWSNPPTVEPAAPTTHLWDGLGRCVRSDQGTSSVVFVYDSLGNPVSETSDGLTLTRSFDHRGRTGITYPDGRSFVESRSELRLLLSVSAIDEVGAPVSPPVVEMEYAGERVWRSTQANGVVTTCVYRGDGESAQPGGNDSSFDRCVRITVTDPSQNILSDTVLRRDGNQRITSSETLFTDSPQGPARSQTFTRDALGRMTGCVTTRRETPGADPVIESDVTYTIDLEGRRLTATGGDNPGTYSQASTIPPGDQQMGQYTTWPGGGLTWDAVGNLSSFSSSAGQLDYVHDAEGRLVALEDPATGTAVIEYGYDALGRRTVRDDQTGKPARFVYDGDVCVQELGTDGNADVSFVCVGGIQRRISTRTGTLLYPQSGGAVTTNVGLTLVTDGTGAPTERFAFDDAGGPIFLEDDGTPSSRRSAIGPIRWMAPESIWEPDYGIFLGGDGIDSPALGMTVSSHHGHVTVLKAPGGGGGHVTVLKIAAGGGGSGNVVRATDHNSSRSNKTSSTR
ncbi:hypothetical protein [Haloferula sp. A504]|uniref:hypothetical protein n=1 Tax=Haloferula sp. A504 TaxID=3373601 RepID=UPI0031BED65A|nr:hypothetical protein [Verrucomicrobiaceae bacterium E54]